MRRRKCVNAEPIRWDWGGGHMCTGECGKTHLHGRAWAWWQCPFCAILADQ